MTRPGYSFRHIPTLGRVAVYWPLDCFIDWGVMIHTTHPELCINNDLTMHILVYILLFRSKKMRTTLDLPESLIDEAMALTHVKTKTDLIKLALQNLIQKEKIKDLKIFLVK